MKTRTFNWLSLLKRYRINYVTEGPNVSAGNVNIKCPFCGPSDPSEHMGLSTSGSAWACWRDSSHRGRNPANLVHKLLQRYGVSWAEALALCGETERKNLSELEEQVRRLKGETKPMIESHYESLDSYAPESRLITTKTNPLTRHAVEWLRRRRISTELAQHWKLRFAMSGALRYRVIMPFLDEQKKEVSWTARTITRDGMPRYKSVKAEKQDSWNVKNLLYGIQQLYWWGNEWSWPDPYPSMGIVLVEGPTDVLRLSYVSRIYGITPLGISGANLSQAQRTLIRKLARFTRQVFVAFDPDNYKGIYKEAHMLNNIEAAPCLLSEKDFGEMSNEELHVECRKMFEVCQPDRLRRKERYHELGRIYTRHLQEDRDYEEFRANIR